MRNLKNEEIRIINDLLNSANIQGKYDLDNYLAEEMNDGDMGSIYLFRNDLPPKTNRKFSKCIATKDYKDADNVKLSVTLNIDQEGHLYELDIWKVDFSQLIRYPV